MQHPLDFADPHRHARKLGGVGVDLDALHVRRTDRRELVGPDAETPWEVAIDTSQTGVPASGACPSIDQSAGKKEFELPANTVREMISDSYHGVSGTYNCTLGQVVLPR